MHFRLARKLHAIYRILETQMTAAIDTYDGSFSSSQIIAG